MKISVQSLLGVLGLTGALAHAQVYPYFPPPGMTYTQTPSALAQTGATPVLSQMIDTSASTNTQNWMLRITGSAIPSTLHALTCTGALTCTDWLTVTRADAANPGIADSTKLFTSSAGFETSLALSSDLIELKAAENGDSTDVQIGSGDIDFFGNLNGDTLLLVDNQSSGTGAFTHLELSAASGGLFEFSFVPLGATLITSRCSGRARDIACLSNSSAASAIGLAGAQGGATMIEAAGGLVADTQTHATSDTNGFFYMPGVAGVPTGVPANLATFYGNGVPMRYDSTDNRLYAYNGGWQNLTPTPLSSPVTVANGGSGLATLPVHGVLLGEGTSNLGNVAAMAADTVLQGQGASADPAATAVPNCGSATSALAYSTSTHTYSCQTISPSGIASVVAKNSDTSRASTTTVTDDPSLQFTSQVAGTYSVEWVVAASGPATTANLKIALNCTGSVTVAHWSMSAMDSNGNQASVPDEGGCASASFVTSSPIATSGAQTGMNHGFGLVVTSTTGTISIQWAQNTTNVGATVVKQGSWMRIQKIL